MKDTPEEMVNRLNEYVNELIELKSIGKENSIRGRTQMIIVVLDKLREAYKSEPFNENLVLRINNEKERSGIDFSQYGNKRKSFCWNCYKQRGTKIHLDGRFLETCEICGWIKCPECGACRDPKYGGCKAFGSETQDDIF